MVRLKAAIWLLKEFFPVIPGVDMDMILYPNINSNSIQFRISRFDKIQISFFLIIPEIQNRRVKKC